MDRIFSSKQKRHLYLSAQGKCQRCGEPLGARWDAHHRRRYADGGVTEITNAVALCERCHVLTHRRIGMIKPRGWQVVALERFLNNEELNFLLEATPGAGKTIFSGLCAQRMFQDQEIDFVLIFVPNITIKGDEDAGFLGDWHKVGVEITRELKDGKGHPKEFKGAVVTYSQLPNLVSSINTWKRNGLRILVIFDEVHHLTETNVWGSNAEAVARDVVKILSMTGTPFRGDGKPISFLRYDKNQEAIADFKFSYRQAVAADPRICRPVQFIHDDGIAEFIRDEEEQKLRVSLAVTQEQSADAARTLFRSDSNWLEAVLERAEDCLDDYRTWDTDAGGLVICRPGNDDNDDKHLMKVARLGERVSGQAPETVHHDDREATSKIVAFRKGTKKWIYAVRKISEGVDIKRLRVLVMANRPTTELLFRQMVGRILRVDNEKNPGGATVFIAKFPQLVEWAARFSKEAQAGLKDAAEKSNQMEPGDEREPSSSFVALGSVHEHGGAISDFGDSFTAAEINTAERERLNDPQLHDIPVTKLAYYRRKLGLQSDPVQTADEPLQIQKTKVRKLIVRATRSLAYRRNPDQPDFSSVSIQAAKLAGARDIDDLFNNYSLDVMNQVLTTVRSWLGGSDAKV